MKKRHKWIFKEGYGLYYTELCARCGAVRTITASKIMPAIDPKTGKKRRWCE